MNISEIHIYHQLLPIVGGSYRMSLSAPTVLDSTVVKLVTDTGLEGYGETCPLGANYQDQHALGAQAALREIAPHLLGMNPLHTGVVNQRMMEVLRGHLYAKAAVDMALWDLLGKVCRLRVCDLLGGAMREHVPSYCAIGIMAPDEAAQVAREKQSQGFRRLQLKVGGREVIEDIAALRKVTEVLQPGVQLIADANRGWNSRDALRVANACRDLPIILEQPCESYAETLAVRRQISLPVYLDESMRDVSSVMRAIADRAADGFGMKLTRVGGISAMRTVRDICGAAGLPMTVDDSWGGDLVAAACMHVAATMPPRLCDGVWIAAPYIEGHLDVESGPEIKDGWIRLPQGPGLGINPDFHRQTASHSFG